MTRKIYISKQYTFLYKNATTKFLENVTVFYIIILKTKPQNIC